MIDKPAARMPLDTTVIAAATFGAALVLVACVTISPEAARVQVHSQVSNLLNDCKKLGPLEASVPRVWGPHHAIETAEVRLRELAYERSGDTVVVLNTDVYLTSVTVHGLALRCYPPRE